MGNETKVTVDELTVGQVLKKRRLALKLSLAQVEVATKIRGKYLVKLESADYSELPNDIYSRGFIFNYAEYLGLDGEKIARQYVNERGGNVDRGEVKRLKAIKSRRLVFTPRMFIVLGSLLAAIIIVSYLSLQFQALAAAPNLQVVNPVGDQVIYGGLIDVSGHVSPGADVFINDSPILIDANGNFSSKLSLSDGVNSIKITAKNKLNKSTTITRNILAHLPAVQAGRGLVPQAVFDGVAIDVSIKGFATALVVKVDDKEAFRGTMLAGTVQDFRGSRIELTTSNAGATSVTITNSVVAQKVLSPLGKDGEVKQSLVFAKDTNFP